MYCTPSQNGNPQQREDTGAAAKKTSQKQLDKQGSQKQEDSEIQVQLNAPADTPPKNESGKQGTQTAQPSITQNDTAAGGSKQQVPAKKAVQEPKIGLTKPTENSGENVTTLVPAKPPSTGNADAEFNPFWILLLIPVVLVVWWLVIRRRLKAPAKPRLAREPIYRSRSQIAPQPLSPTNPQHQEPQSAVAGNSTSQRFRTTSTKDKGEQLSNDDFEFQSDELLDDSDHAIEEPDLDVPVGQADVGNSAELELDELLEEAFLPEDKHEPLDTTGSETTVGDQDQTVRWNDSLVEPPPRPHEVSSSVHTLNAKQSAPETVPQHSGADLVQIQELQQMNKSLAAQLSDLQQHRDQMACELETSRLNQQKAERQLIEFKENDKLPVLEQELETLTARLQDTELEKQNLTTELVDLRETLAQSQNELAQIQSLSDDLANQKAELNGRLDDQAIQLKQAQQELANAADDVAVDDRLPSLEREVQALNARLQDVVREKDQLAAERVDAQNENDKSRNKLQGELVRLQSLSEDLENQKVTLTDELNQRDSQLKLAEQQVAELSKQVENDLSPELEKEVDSLTSQLQEIARDKESLSAELHAINETHAKSQSEIEQLRMKFEELETERTDLAEKLSDRESQLQEAQQELAQMLSTSQVAAQASPEAEIDPKKYAKIRKKAFLLHADLRKQRKQSESIFAELIETRQKLQQAQRDAGQSPD